MSTCIGIEAQHRAVSLPRKDGYSNMALRLIANHNQDNALLLYHGMKYSALRS
jgi:hypothetical protein